MSAVEFNDVVKIYGKGEGKQVAVDHVSFTIEKGEFVVILGQSGAGNHRGRYGYSDRGKGHR